MARYELRMEMADGTLEEAYHSVSVKADALKFARRAAKTTADMDAVRVWVDDSKTGLGVQSFKVTHD